MRKLAAEKIVRRRAAFRGRLLRVDVLNVRLKSGVCSVREVVRHPGAVAVLARVPDGRFVFVRQYRRAVGRVLCEIVAGTLEKGENPRVCAVRELAEETGFRAKGLCRLGRVLPAPGYTDEVIHLYMADVDARPRSCSPDADEEIETVFLTAPRVNRAIRSGEICDAKTIAAWYCYLDRICGGRSRGPKAGS